jgi:hypothetical protein
VYDLLARSEADLGRALKVRENKAGVFAEGAALREVSCWEDMRLVFEEGQRNRTVATTNMNMESSRSHAIITLEFKQVTTRKGAAGDDSVGKPRGRKTCLLAECPSISAFSGCLSSTMSCLCLGRACLRHKGTPS